MSRFFFTACALSAGVSFSSLAVAQQPATTAPNQLNQATPQQKAQLDAQHTQPHTGASGQKLQEGQNRQAGMTVTQLLVNKLRKANEGEVALARMVEDKSDNQDLRQFTQMIMQAHQAMLQQLDQVAGKQGGSGTKTDATLISQVQSQISNIDGAVTQTGTQSQQVPQQLWQVIDQACENSHKMTVEMLKEHDGPNFQMAYLGYEIVAHTMQLAELQAIQSSGPQELKLFAQQASEKTQSHLEMAKKLAKKQASETATKE